jgi:hypothetical protein
MHACSTRPFPVPLRGGPGCSIDGPGPGTLFPAGPDFVALQVNQRPGSERVEVENIDDLDGPATSVTTTRAGASS